MTKNEIKQRLDELKIKYNPADSRAKLMLLLPDKVLFGEENPKADDVKVVLEETVISENSTLIARPVWVDETLWKSFTDTQKQQVIDGKAMCEIMR